MISISQSIASAPQFDQNVSHTKLTEWMIMDDQAFALVGNSYFKAYIESLQPCMILPSPSSLACDIYHRKTKNPDNTPGNDNATRCRTSATNPTNTAVL